MKTEQNKKGRRARAEILNGRRFREVRRCFASGRMEELLDGYVRSCYEGAEESTEKSAEKRQGGARRAARFPNPAGFCRYLGIEEAAYAALEREFPSEAGRLRAIFLDEAWSAPLSPSVLSLYLKFFFGDTDGDGEGCGEGLSVSFDHDILADGR